MNEIFILIIVGHFLYEKEWEYYILRRIYMNYTSCKRVVKAIIK